MSTLLHWFTSPEWAQIVKTLLHSLWQGALIALALAVFMRRLANPVSRYRCSLTALACVVVAGIITWAVMNTADGRTPSPVQNQPTAENQNAHNFAATMDASPEDKIIVTANRTPAATSMRWTAWLALVWLAGAGAMLARAGVKVAGAEKLRRSCQPLNDSRVEKLLAEARRAVSLARQVRVGVTDKLTSPAVVGIFVPMLILPLSLLTTLTPEQIHFVLLHELAHIRRGDYLANLFQFFAESLLFFNPAVWWISHQVRREREACCDALAIELSGAPVDYARTLVHVAENMLQPASAAATAFSEKREPSSLIDRVQRLLVPGYRPSLRLTWRAMLAALVLGSALLVLSATGTRMTVAAILTPEQRTEQIEKKMTEVGQKPETMSDSAEQNKEMKSSATNITDNPQGTVRFEIDLYTRFANLQKLSGLRETNSLEEQLQKLFSEAGVKPPLTNVMITKEGTLVVRGTKEQLDLVMKVVQHLMMTSHNNSRTLTNENLNLAEAGTLLQDGKLLWEMDKLTEAEAKLRKALDLDPQNYAAAYYLSLVHEARLNVATSRRGSDAQTMVHTNLIYTSKGRQAIANKLDRIHLDSIVFPAGGLPLSEVLRNLSEESKKRDPEKRGINFIINSGVESAPAAAPVEGGGGLPAVPAEPLDLGAVIVKLNPGLTDVRLADVLDAVVKVAERPIKYSIEDYAVVFSQRGAESAQLYTRWFRVDPNTFSEGLNSVIAATFGVSGSSGGGGGQQGGGGSSGGGGGGGNNGGTRSTVARVSVTGGGAGGTTPGGAGAGGAGGGGIRFVTSNNTMQDEQVAVRLFFTTMGVDLNPLLGKNLFFNDKSGVLFVRATLQDLDIIETAIQALNVTPPLVNIKARFAEIAQNDNRALGFDWYLGNVLMDNGKIGAQAGTAPSYAGAPTAANPEGTFPGSFLNATAIGQAATDALLTGGLRNGAGAPALGTITGILTNPQFRVVLHALEQRQGVNLLNAPEVTTISGRQAQIRVLDVRTIVSDLNINQTGSGGGGNTGVNGANNGGGGVIGSVIQPITSQFEEGPELDVIPYVSADEHTIHMSLIPSVTEFVGYDDAGQFTAQAQSASSGGAGVAPQLIAAVPLPRFRLRQVVTSVVVWDGQTVVLGGLLSENITRMKDKVPLLGDLPWIGRLWRSESSVSIKKNLMIFVTPTIIDPAGNRYHTDDDMPFGPSSIVAPPQTAPNP